MAFWTLQAVFSITLAASAAHGQTNDDVMRLPDLSVHSNQADVLTAIDGLKIMHATMPDVSVRYDQVVSPETFTFNENVAWAVRSFLRPKETLGNAVVMYGYEFNSACVESALPTLDTPAVLAVQPRIDTAGTGQVTPTFLYSVTLYETVADACDARKVVQALVNASAGEAINLKDVGTDLERESAILAKNLSMQVVPFIWSPSVRSDTARTSAYSELEAAVGDRHIAIPGYLPVDTATAASFALEIGEIEKANEDTLIFTVGRIPGAGKGLELWAFCAEVGQCFGHQADDSFTSSHFAGVVNSNLEIAPYEDTPIVLPAEAED